MDKLKNMLYQMGKFIMISYSTTSLVWVTGAMIQHVERIRTMDFIYILGLCVVSAILERIFLSPRILKKLTYNQRGFLLILIICIIICTYAVKAKWFPISVLGITIRFLISYIIGCAIFLITDNIFTKEGEKYTKILNEYKKKNADK